MSGRSNKGRRELRAPRGARSGNVAVLPALRGGLKALERRLYFRLGSPVALEMTDNTYTMISFSRRRLGYTIRLHRMFLRANEQVIQALASYIRGEDRSASGLLDRFIHENRRQIRQVPPTVRQRRLALNATGQHHDLRVLLEEVKEESFGELAHDVAIAWAPAPPVRVPRRSIKLGSYSADTQIIRIHPALDQAFVPAFFIRWIVHHELLHHVFRADLKARNGRVHTPEFCALERQFPEFREALMWERRHLDVLLWWESPRRTLRPTGT